MPIMTSASIKRSPIITCLINYGGIITYLGPCGCLLTVNFNHFKSSRVRHNKVSWWHLVALFRVFSVFLGTGNYRLATGAQHLPGSAATLRLSFVYARRFIVEIELVR